MRIFDGKVYRDMTQEEIMQNEALHKAPKITAPQNLTAGDYVTINGVLYLTTDSIPNGEPVIIGQNAIETTIEAQLRELKGE